MSGFKGKCIVYALLDPVTNEVRYVGGTKDVGTRYRNHINLICSQTACGSEDKAKWIYGLHRRGLIPGILILEITPAKRLTECERKWIDIYRARGARLVNFQWTLEELAADYQI